MTVSPYDQAFYQHQADGSRRSAEIVLPIVFDWVGHPNSVVDVGCGLGTWLAVCLDRGVDEILGIDGDYVEVAQLHIPKKDFLARDLLSPHPVEQKYDLAMSLEVGEHLPEKSAQILVGYLTSLSDKVLFSAAIPGQGGVHHVNEQWPSYWANIFSSWGYVALDPIRPAVWQNPLVERFYSQNTFLYLKKELVTKNERYLAEAERFKRCRLMLVYDNIAMRQPTISQSAKILGVALQRSIRKRLGLRPE